MARNTLLTVRGGTTSQWAASTEGVNIRELVYNTETNELKVGRSADGSTFASLTPIGKPQSGPSLPASGFLNDLYYNTTDSMLYIWNGSMWKSTGITSQHLTDIYTVTSQTAQLNLTVKKGDVCKRDDLAYVYMNSTGSNSSMSDWVLIADNRNIINDVAGDGSTTVTWSADKLSDTFSSMQNQITGVLKESDLANGALGTYKKIPGMIRRAVEESDHGVSLATEVPAAGILVYDNGLKVGDGSTTIQSLKPLATFPDGSNGALLYHTGSLWGSLTPNSGQIRYLKAAADGTLSWDSLGTGLPLPPEGTLEGTLLIYLDGSWQYVQPDSLPVLSADGVVTEDLRLKLTRVSTKSGETTTVEVTASWTDVIDGGEILV